MRRQKQHSASVLALWSLEPQRAFVELTPEEQHERVSALSHRLASMKQGADNEEILQMAGVLRGGQALASLATFAASDASRLRLTLSVITRLSRLGLSQGLCLSSEVRTTVVSGLLASEEDDEMAACALPCAFQLSDNEHMLRALCASATVITPLLVQWLLASDAASPGPERGHANHVSYPHYWRDAHLSAEMARCAARLMRNMRSHADRRQASIRVLSATAHPIAAPSGAEPDNDNSTGARSARQRLKVWLRGKRRHRALPSDPVLASPTDRTLVQV